LSRKVIYHANCFDGICSAWVIWKIYPDSEFIPMHYGDKKFLDNIEQDCYENANINDEYIFVDFSIPRVYLELLSSKCPVLVLDHHITAKESLEGLDYAIFDMNESGASLAWKYYHYISKDNLDMPILIRYIKDRDLWKFNEPYSDEINAYIQSFPMEIPQYNQLDKLLSSDDGFRQAFTGGSSILRYKQTMTETICKNMLVRIVGGYNVPTVNAMLLFSEIGNNLCKMYPEFPFAASFFIRSDNKIQWSLRSIGDFDVSLVAKANGGGGHKNAAGFESDKLD
jgi:oligoribonuclease NrnB/cAMP/cGMP phosphodiesterase (DHH superfamily)